MAKAAAPKTVTKAATKSEPAKAAQGTAHTVMPHLVCAGAAKAIAFYKKAFGANETFRLDGADGKLMHACVVIGNSPIFLVDEYPEWNSLGPLARKGTSVTLHMTVADADAAVAKAVAARDGDHAGRRNVLGRSLRDRHRPVRAPLVDRPQGQNYDP